MLRIVEQGFAEGVERRFAEVVERRLAQIVERRLAQGLGWIAQGRRLARRTVGVQDGVGQAGSVRIAY